MSSLMKFLITDHEFESADMASSLFLHCAPVLQGDHPGRRGGPETEGPPGRRRGQQEGHGFQIQDSFLVET